MFSGFCKILWVHWCFLNAPISWWGDFLQHGCSQKLWLLCVSPHRISHHSLEPLSSSDEEIQGVYMTYSLFPKAYWKQDKTLHVSFSQCRSLCIQQLQFVINTRNWSSFSSKLPGSDSSLFLTVLPSLLRNPGVFPPSAEGHHWVCRAEDWRVPEPQRSGQCHSLLPPYRAGFGKAKPPHQHGTRNFQLKSRSASGFSRRRVWEMLLSSFSCSQGLSGAVLLESLGMSMGMVCTGTRSGLWDGWIWILHSDFILEPKAAPCLSCLEIKLTGVNF